MMMIKMVSYFVALLFCCFVEQWHSHVFFTFLAFFDEFERQTRGENFSSAAAAAAAATVSAIEKEEVEKRRQEIWKAEKERQKLSDREELDQFFDEFEKSTQGENFKRKGP